MIYDPDPSRDNESLLDTGTYCVNPTTREEKWKDKMNGKNEQGWTQMPTPPSNYYLCGAQV